MGLRFIYSPTSLNVAPFSFRLWTLEGFLIYLASGHCLDFTASLLDWILKRLQLKTDLTPTFSVAHSGWEKACLSLALPGHSQLAPADLLMWPQILLILKNKTKLTTVEQVIWWLARTFLLDFCLFIDSSNKSGNLVNLWKEKILTLALLIILKIQDISERKTT